MCAQTEITLTPSTRSEIDIELPNGDMGTLYNGREQKILLLTDKRLKGKIILFKEKFGIYKSGPFIFSKGAMEVIKKLGLKLGDIDISPENVTVVNDTMLYETNEFNEFQNYDQIKAIDKAGLKSSINFKRTNVSFGFLGSALNPADVMEKQMNSSGMNDSKVTGFDLDLVPDISLKLDFDFQVYINSSHGVLFNYTIENNEVSGYKELEYTSSGLFSGTSDGYELNLNLNNQLISMAYTFSLLNQRANFIAGPSLLSMLKTSEITGGFNNSKNEIRENKVGFIVGSSFNLIHRGSMFINVKAYYRWYPKGSLGPYTLSGLNEYGTETSSTFEQIDVPLQWLHIGFGLGFRL